MATRRPSFGNDFGGDVAPLAVASLQSVASFATPSHSPGQPRYGAKAPFASPVASGGRAGFASYQGSPGAMSSLLAAQRHSLHAAGLSVNRENREMQTDASFYPTDAPLSLVDHFSGVSAQQFRTLEQLRQRLKDSMSALGGSIHDLGALKDVLLHMRTKLPHAPLTDLLLVSSKLFRHGSETTRLLGAFFNIVFADGYTDEHFRFTELRLLRKETAGLSGELASVRRERDELRAQLDLVSATTRNHASAVETLESRNDVLEVRSAALEDQMALLFQQLTDDFVFYNESLLQKTNEELDVQDVMSATRSTFTQSIDAVQSRLKFFQLMLAEIEGDVGAAPAEAAGGGGWKAKIKALNVHVQHVASRFTSVKDGLSNVASDLTNALRDKRSVLNFAVQHLKSYETQNQKLRSCRAQMHELRQHLTNLERAISHTFAPGSLVRVERGGDVSVAPPPNPDGSPGRKPPKAVANVRQLLEHVEAAQGAVVRMSGTLNTDEEHRALMKSLALAVPSTARDSAATAPSGHIGKTLSARNRQVLANVSASSGGGGGGGGAANATADVSPSTPGGGAVPLAQYRRMREDFAAKLTFLREVYEERVYDLEAKVERLGKKLHAETLANRGNAVALSAYTSGQVSVPGGDGTVGSGNATTTGTMPGAEATAGGESAGGGGTATTDDRLAAINAKERWVATRQGLGGPGMAAKHDALARLDELQAEVTDDARLSRSYVSPLFYRNLVAVESGTAAAGAAGLGISEKASAVVVARTATGPLLLPRTDHSRFKQSKDAEVLRILRRLAATEQRDAEGSK